MQSLTSVVARFQDELRNKIKLPVTSFNRSWIGKDGEPNRAFLLYLCTDFQLTVSFLQSAGLIKSEMYCDSCKEVMQLIHSPNVIDGMEWVCNNIVRGELCSTRSSVRLQSWFTESNLSIPEALCLTYEIVYHTKMSDIQREYDFDTHMITDWANFCREIITDYIETHSTKIGGPDKTVEVDTSKVSSRNVTENCRERLLILGGVERESGKTFLAAVDEDNLEEHVEVIKDWILPGTTIITGFEGFCDLKQYGYEHLTVNRAVSFVDESTGAHTNTIQSMWRHIKSFLPEYDGEEYNLNGYLAEYIFKKQSQAENENVFNKFLEAVREIQW